MKHVHFCEKLILSVLIQLIGRSKSIFVKALDIKHGLMDKLEQLEVISSTERQELEDVGDISVGSVERIFERT